MAQKLKNMHLTSVDLVRRGANQEADICLFKSADPQEATESPTEGEKNIFKRFLNWLRDNPTEGEDEPEDPIEKADEQPALTDIYKSAITESLQSIAADTRLTADEKYDMIEKSIGQYHDRMMELLVMQEEDLEKSDDEDLSYLLEDLEKSDFDDFDRFDDIEEVEVEKFNPYHDSRGRFTSAKGGGGGAAGGGAVDNSPQGYNDKIKDYRAGFSSGQYGVGSDPDFKTMQSDGNKLFDKYDKAIKKDPAKAKKELFKERDSLEAQRDQQRGKLGTAYTNNDKSQIAAINREIKMIDNKLHCVSLISAAAKFNPWQ